MVHTTTNGFTITDSSSRLKDLPAELATFADQVDAAFSSKSSDLDSRVNAKLTDLDSRVNAKLTDLDSRVNAKLTKIDVRLDEFQTQINTFTSNYSTPAKIYAVADTLQSGAITTPWKFTTLSTIQSDPRFASSGQGSIVTNFTATDTQMASISWSINVTDPGVAAMDGFVTVNIAWDGSATPKIKRLYPIHANPGGLAIHDVATLTVPTGKHTLTITSWISQHGNTSGAMSLGLLNPTAAVIMETLK